MPATELLDRWVPVTAAAVAGAGTGQRVAWELVRRGADTRQAGPATANIAPPAGRLRATEEG